MSEKAQVVHQIDSGSRNLGPVPEIIQRQEGSFLCGGYHRVCRPVSQSFDGIQGRH